MKVRLYRCTYYTIKEDLVPSGQLSISYTFQDKVLPFYSTPSRVLSNFSISSQWDFLWESIHIFTYFLKKHKNLIDNLWA